MNLLNGIKMNEVKLYLNYAGYCIADARHAVKGEKKRLIKFKALYALILHPLYGYILFDTGYTNRFFDATKNYPNKIYALTTKVKLKKSEEVKAQLKSHGISSNEIKHIIISHFHADHIGGLKDFNNAKFYCTKKSFNQVKSISNFFAFSKGILKKLIPEDFEERVCFIEDVSKLKEDNIFNKAYDLFGDKSINIYNLPGHAAGQIGILIKTKIKNYFLLADACWDIRAITEEKTPNKIVKLFFDSWSDYISSLNKLRKFNKKFPQTIMIPTHCSKTTENLVSDKIDFNVL